MTDFPDRNLDHLRERVASGQPQPAVDLKVTTKNPELLAQTLHDLPGCGVLVNEDTFDGETVTVRVLWGLSFLKFAMEKQGYGSILEERPVS
jgi:hypothetical protein